MTTTAPATHLADFAFRFGVRPDELPAPFAPPAGDTWSLGETLREIARRDATLRLTSRGVRLLHAHAMPALARHISRHARALTLWLRLGGDAETQAVAPGWPPDVRLHAAWLLRSFEAPAGPLALAPGVVVRDVSAFRAAVSARLARGPAAPGASALAATLAGLFERFATVEAPVVRVGYAMAA